MKMIFHPWFRAHPSALRHPSLVTRLLPLLLSFSLLAPALGQDTAPTAAEGIGPFTLDTTQGPVEARLIRRDGDQIWVLRRLDSGQVVRVALPVAAVQRVRIPETAVAGVLARIRTVADRPAAVAELKRIEDMLAPYRDLPGVVADDAAFQRARLLEAMENYGEAAQLYVEITRYRHRPDLVSAATLRAGLCAAKLGRPAQALSLLDLALVAEPDVDLLADVLFARATVLAGLGRHEEAVLAWLRLVVFHPFVHRSEPRSLEAILPSYAALQEWAALAQSLESLRTTYPDAPETTRALAAVAAAPWRETLTARTGYTPPPPAPP